MPLGQMELTINLSGDNFLIGERSVSATPAIVVGCQSDYFVIDTSCPATLLSVLFKPAVSLDVFGLSARELHNQIVTLNEIWGSGADGFYNQLMVTPSVSERFVILENALLSRLTLYRERHYAVEFALNALMATSASVSIAHLQQEVALSPPRFIQVFRNEIGLTPKLFSRLKRFHRLLDVISMGHNVDWAELALHLGFYDQSHMINEFQKFAGISPSAYAPMDQAHNKNIPYLENS